MARQPRLSLSEKDLEALREIVHRGVHKAREINRARVLLWASEGKSYFDIASLLGLTRQTVGRVIKRYNEGGIIEALFDKNRVGRPKTIGAKEEAILTIIACSDPPEGRERWTLFMLRDRLVELSELDSISHESVRQVLKKKPAQAMATETVADPRHQPGLHRPNGNGH